MNKLDIDLVENIQIFRNDWNKFAVDIFGVRLDRKQRKILRDIQENNRVSIRSGHARGKDYVAAVSALCFLYLHKPSVVINTSTTDRQVNKIIMAEISKIHREARVNLGGEVLENGIKFVIDNKPIKEWYLIGFVTNNKDNEKWSGFHSENIMVIVSEASGVSDEVFSEIEGLLTGTISKLIIIFNPNRLTGEAFRSSRSKLYVKHKLNCLNAPNVRAKRNFIPGQVDYDWVKQKINMPGWSDEIDKEEFRIDMNDFKFEDKYYRPTNLFRTKVLGEFPLEEENILIPNSWIDIAVERWIKQKKELTKKINGALKLGVDIAGMGRDKTVFAFRRGNIIESIVEYSYMENPAHHMIIAGKIKNILRNKDDCAYIDTIGEGAGVHSRLAEQDVNSVSVKYSESARGLTDMTGERKFANIRAYLYWAFRDSLDPKFDIGLALPYDYADKIKEDISELKWEERSNGEIILTDKEKIRSAIGRSPDETDAIVNTFYKVKKLETRFRMLE